MSRRIKKYELTQNGRKYFLTNQIEGDVVKITCKEIGIPNPPLFLGAFSLDQLRQLNTIFNSINTISDAQKLFNKTVENQRVSVEPGDKIINIILYFSKDSETEESLTMKIELTKDIIYNKPVVYQSFTQSPPSPLKQLPTQVVSKTTETTTKPTYSPLKRLPDTHVNVPQMQTVTTPTKEIYSNSQENYQNYDNLDLNSNIQTENEDYNALIASAFGHLTSPANTTETQNQDLNKYFIDNHYQINYDKPYITPVIEEPQITYDPNITSPKREQIQYVIPGSPSTAEITFHAVPSKKNPDILQQQQKIVETKTTTTTQQYNPVTQNQNVDISIYNQKISELQNETDKIKGEYNILKGESNKLNEEIGQLKGKIHILLEENKILREKNDYRPNEKQIHEISILKEENEKLKKKLEQYIAVQNTFDEYKKLKEEEINYLKLQIEELLKSQKKSDEILFNKQKENDDLNNQIKELKNNLHYSESQSLLHQQQLQAKNKMGKQVLTIHDTRTELVKGDIIDSTSELELLTRKICKKHRKVILDLLYKATVDSDKATAFHNKCDFANRTLVLVKSGNGKRFGGYTSCNWRGDSIEKKDEDAFVFSLDKMQIYDIIPGEDAIGCYPRYGPVFLGCQIRIYDEFFTYGGSTFERGANYNTQEDYELTGGLKKFKVKEIEVYSVEFE